MRSICFYFQVHQPLRLKTYRFFEIGKNHYYYDDFQNRYIIKRVAEKCYIPTNQILLDLIKDQKGAFKVSFCLSGIVLEQFEKFAPEVIESFQKLSDTGCVEFLTETNSHSLASLRSKDEFINQVKTHSRQVEHLFGQKPAVFRNTELIYSDYIGEIVSEMGFEAILAEGAKHVLGWKSPNYVYCNPTVPKLKLLLKNFQLSDDIAFRFSNRDWEGWPLTAEKYVEWLNVIPQEEKVVNLFMDYETFGEHQWPETGIFDFMRALPYFVQRNSDFQFHTPSEVAERYSPVGAIHVPYAISWADEERDLTAWLGNELQNDAFDTLYSMEEKIRQCNNEQILNDWKNLQTSDHFYYMCTKWFSDGDVHKYFNPYSSPYDAFINYMNILTDFSMRVDDVISMPQPATTKEKKTTKRTTPAKKKVTPVAGKQDAIIAEVESHVLNKPLPELKKIVKKVDNEFLAIIFAALSSDSRDKILSALSLKRQKEFHAMKEQGIKIHKGKQGRYIREFVKMFLS